MKRRLIDAYELESSFEGEEMMLSDAILVHAKIAAASKVDCEYCEHDGEWDPDEKGGGHCGECFCGDRFERRTDD